MDKDKNRFSSSKKQNRLNTENLKMNPLSQEEAELMVKILLSPIDDSKDWKFNPDVEFDTEVKGEVVEEVEIPWIFRVIRKRIIEENLKIEITKKAYFLIFLFTNSNPGKAIFVLRKIGNLFERTKAKKWLVTSEIFTTNLFPDGFPSEKSWEKWWKEQKKKSK